MIKIDTRNADSNERRKLVIEKIRDELARPTSLSLNADVRDLDRVLESEISGERRSIDFVGWPYLSTAQALLPGTVTIICGSPGASKSFFIMEQIWRWMDEGEDASILAMEKDAPFSLRRAWAQMACFPGVLNVNVVRNHPQVIRDLRAQWDEPLRKLRTRIQIPNKDMKNDRKYIIQWLKKEVELGRRIIVIDPITMMDSSGKMGAEEHDKTVKDIARVAETSNVAIILVTHPRQGNAGQDIFPSLNNIPGSSAYQRFSDTILWLQTIPEDAEEIGEYNREVFCLKVRLAANPGRIKFRFNVKNLCHEEVGIV